MRINFAHIRESSTSGTYIDFAVFEGRSASGLSQDNAALLTRWTISAKAQGLKVDQSALAYAENGRIRFQGSQNLVQYLAKRGVPRWTHYLDD
jgi:hypothetical protein